jgi:endonuclease/exonuclease/phosphatase family metal-dependent hydrolase
MKVMTLNLAHGRGQRWHQWLLKRAAIEANLDRVSAVLRRESPDVVALQEADGPSYWSGDFDHVAYLAEAAGYPYLVRGEHVQRRRLVYGTALLSKIPVHDALSVTFTRSITASTKGFVVARLALPGRHKLSVDVAAVHLDCLRARVRRRQVSQIVESLATRGVPLVVMGDFNCGWHGRASPLRRLAEGLGLSAYCATSRRPWTFPRLRRRIDWILISPALEFAHCANLPDRVSDHRAVQAKLVLAK